MLKIKGAARCGFLLLLLLAGCSQKSEVKSLVTPIPAPLAPQSVQPMRGIWLATVNHLDWPPPSSLSLAAPQRIAQQQQALLARLDKYKELGINTVFFQVKPDSSAFYRSAILPWSAELTGVTGKDPGYDPLAFILTEAHRRGLKVHAWLNPYRVSMNTSPATVNELENTLADAPASVFALHRDWVRVASDRFVLDPGLPQVRQWINGVVAELVKNYAIDGVQFDDYFYYETPSSKLNDNSSWRDYGSGFADKASWRRDNTLKLVKEVATTIKSLKPNVAFGISPAGVWRNSDEDERGSDTRGGAAYDLAFADTRLWVKEGLLDYIAPQLYWPFGRKIVRYPTLAKWWADVVGSGHTKLYIGVALYKVGEPTKAEPQWGEEQGVAELKRQIELNETLPGVAGTILFRDAFLDRPQTQEAVNYLRDRWRTAQ
ncbi:glycoside hydrolase family 10 protein [Kalamiella sp. sgz302252]|uniref:glycoside hydrolase family 10 protein n=1 Tax=Pantoea sp. sgz302252 TaxID=3341827 RepID=UPI0036D2D685